MTGHAYIELTSPDAHKIDPAQSSRSGGKTEADAPYTGNGFVGNTDNTWRPEYTSDGVGIKPGAKLWQVGPNGRQLVATMGERDWVPAT